MLVPGDVFEHAREQEMKALDPLFAPTRYEKEFEEMGILGRGGYGTVATAKHRIDGQHYAVKRYIIHTHTHTHTRAHTHTHTHTRTCIG
jgi:hypothetical protein